ncbi:unnamed protein product [Meloidogyne enterolobii]|uniref:Uncharacterized protein n=1 Tax=Meloidogyne enterolobii TaxID=390850 RepID=A0ACB0YB18_MELEN
MFLFFGGKEERMGIKNIEWNGKRYENISSRMGQRLEGKYSRLGSKLGIGEYKALVFFITPMSGGEEKGMLIKNSNGREMEKKLEGEKSEGN